jgi:hypothetical protein
MIVVLRKDYDAMKGMIFGEIPAFDSVLESIYRLEQEKNTEVVYPFS